MIDVIKEVREKLSNESAWTKGFYAKDIDGFYATSEGKEACKWCLMGAVFSVAGYDSEMGRDIETFLNGMVSRHFVSVTDFNDRVSTTHSDIMSFLDRSIRFLENEIGVSDAE